MQNLYEADFYSWTQEQANLLRHHQWNQLDLPNLIEEIESLLSQNSQVAKFVNLIILHQSIDRFLLSVCQSLQAWLSGI